MLRNSYLKDTIDDELKPSSSGCNKLVIKTCGNEFNENSSNQDVNSQELFSTGKHSSNNPGSNSARRGWSNLVKSMQRTMESNSSVNILSNLPLNEEERICLQGENNDCDEQTTPSMSTVKTETSPTDLETRRTFSVNLRRSFRLPRRRIIIPLRESNAAIEKLDDSNTKPNFETESANLSAREASSRSNETCMECSVVQSFTTTSKLERAGSAMQFFSTSAISSADVDISSSHDEDELSEMDVAEALSLCIESAHALLKSREMGNFVRSTVVLSRRTTTVAVYTITLPVRIPFNICSSAAKIIVSATNDVLSQSSSYLTNVIVRSTTHSSIMCSTGESTDSDSNHVDPLSIVIRSISFIPGTLFWTIPITCVGIAATITNDFASNALSVVTGNRTRINFDRNLSFHELELTEEDFEHQSESEQQMIASSDSQSAKVGWSWKWFGQLSEAGQSTAEPGQYICGNVGQRRPSVQSLEYLDRLRLDFNPASLTTDATEKTESGRVVTHSKKAVSGDKSQIVDDLKKAGRAYFGRLQNFKTLPEDTHNSPSECPEQIIRYACRVIEGKSKHLLRIDDVDVKIIPRGESLKTGDGLVVTYVDLALQSEDDRSLLRYALDKLIHRGLSMLANHPPARLSSKNYGTCPATEVKWNPIGSTTKDALRQMSSMSNKLERIEVLKRETLVWSGEYVHQKGYECYGRNFSFYLARGILEFSPSNLLRLFWDDTRTKEYNQYSNGRFTDLSIVSDDILAPQKIESQNGEALTSTTTTGTKAIRSETRVPLTKFTLQTRCLMHVRALDAPDDGYVIVTRSLDEGDAGLHFRDESSFYEKTKSVDKCDNQIVWGLNIIKAVPNHSHLSDLISLSQVSTANVPGFLSKRIATMGIEDFFSNVRKLEKVTTST